MELSETEALQRLSFDELIQQKLAIEAELDQRADTELAAIKERLSLIAAYKGIELETLLAKKERKKREPRKPRTTDETIEDIAVA
jgi:hypothetical protein